LPIRYFPIRELGNRGVPARQPQSSWRPCEQWGLTSRARRKPARGVLNVSRAGRALSDSSGHRLESLCRSSGPLRRSMRLGIRYDGTASAAPRYKRGRKGPHQWPYFRPIFAASNPRQREGSERTDSEAIKDAYVESFSGKFRDECLNENTHVRVVSPWSFRTEYRQVGSDFR
jgi:hypothetical protein